MCEDRIVFELVKENLGKRFRNRDSVPLSFLSLIPASFCTDTACPPTHRLADAAAFWHRANMMIPVGFCVHGRKVFYRCLLSGSARSGDVWSASGRQTGS